LPNCFSGDLDLAKPRLNFPTRRRGLGEECGRGFGIRFLPASNYSYDSRIQKFVASTY
jgi:hypothetical protein